jgi:CheY-like chemotaxis protein
MNDTGRPLSVLIVDDDLDTAQTTSTLLSMFGHETRFALGGQEALSLAATDPPDVVLLDVRMPGIDGCGLTRRLTNLLSRRPPLIVAMTGSPSEADRTRAYDAGVNHYLTKPVEPGVLVGMMERVSEAFLDGPFDFGLREQVTNTTDRTHCHA